MSDKPRLDMVFRKCLWRIDSRTSLGRNRRFIKRRVIHVESQPRSSLMTSAVVSGDLLPTIGFKPSLEGGVIQPSAIPRLSVDKSLGSTVPGARLSWCVTRMGSPPSALFTFSESWAFVATGCKCSDRVGNWKASFDTRGLPSQRTGEGLSEIEGILRSQIRRSAGHQ